MLLVKSWSKGHEHNQLTRQAETVVLPPPSNTNKKPVSLFPSLGFPVKFGPSCTHHCTNMPSNNPGFVEPPVEPHTHWASHLQPLVLASTAHSSLSDASNSAMATKVRRITYTSRNKLQGLEPFLQHNEKIHRHFVTCTCESFFHKASIWESGSGADQRAETSHEANQPNKQLHIKQRQSN